MKKLLLIIGILIAANVLLAQEEKSTGDKAENFKEKLKNRLELTADQESQLKELRKKYGSELKSIRTDEEKLKSEKLYAAAAMMEKKESELASILSAKQLSELRTIKKEVRQKRINRRERTMKRRSRH